MGAIDEAIALLESFNFRKQHESDIFAVRVPVSKPIQTNITELVNLLRCAKMTPTATIYKEAVLSLICEADNTNGRLGDQLQNISTMTIRQIHTQISEDISPITIPNTPEGTEFKNRLLQIYDYLTTPQNNQTESEKFVEFSMLAV